MGETDKRMKDLLRVKEVFAQLISVAVFKKKNHIQKGNLSELDSVLIAENKQNKMLERLQDIRMQYKASTSMNLILCTEEQSDIHYYMPVRRMLYDAMGYDEQCRAIATKERNQKTSFPITSGIPKGSKISPILSLVFYVGAKPWDGPRDLYDLFALNEEERKEVSAYLPNYPINLIDARHLTKAEIDSFEGDLKAFLIMINEDYQKTDLKGITAKYRQTWYAVGAIKKDQRYMEYIDSISEEELQEGQDMCRTLDYYEELGRKQGIEQGIEQTRNTMILHALKNASEDTIEKIMGISKSDILQAKQWGLAHSLEN